MVLLHPTDQSMFPIPGGMKPVATVAGILCEKIRNAPDCIIDSFVSC